MSGPRRLMDDPDFKWESGCDLADEAVLHESADLAALKERVLSAVQGAPPVPDGGAVASGSGVGSAGGSAGVLVGALGVGAAMVAALGVGYVLGTAQPGAVGTPTQPMSVERAHVEVAPVGRAPADTPEPSTVRAARVGLDAVTLEAPASPKTAPAPAALPISQAAVREAGTSEAPLADGGAPAEGPVVEAAVEAVVSERGAADADESAAPVPMHSGLAAEMALYDDAVQALSAGDHAVAASGFKAYLRRYPEGQLNREAELSLLECYFEEGSFAEAEAQAARLLSHDGFVGRRHELSLMRAESLILLGQCDEAVVIVDGLTERDARAVAVRRECKRRR